MVEEGLTVLVQVVPPVPVTVPPLLNVKVHAPLTDNVPLTVALLPLQIVEPAPVILAVGAVMVTISEPESVPAEQEDASVSVEIV